MEHKRIIEVFTAGCSVCASTVELVKSIACSFCEVVVYDLSKPCESQECVQKVKQYSIKSLPAVVVNGVLLNCCQSQGVSVNQLTGAGLGSPVVA